MMSTKDAQFTVKGVNGESAMNRAAYEEYQQALESRRANGRYTLEEAAIFIHEVAGERADEILKKLMAAAGTDALATYEPNKKARYMHGNNFASRVRDFYEEAYWNDLNDWLNKNEPRLVCKFPTATAPVEQSAPARIVDKTEQQDDAILKWLKENNYDPLKLPMGKQGNAGIRKLCGDAVCKTYKLSRPVFNTAWDRLRAAEKTMVEK
jgi:hypothetical protein